MKSNSSSVASKAALALALAVSLSACSKGASSAGGTATPSVSADNVFGQVSQSVTVSSFKAQPKVSSVISRLNILSSMRGRPSQKGDITALAVSGCTIQALDMLTNAVVATTTSGSDGTYTLSGVKAGTTYKISANCGPTEKYTSIAKADATAPANKEPEVTSPISTIIAAKIMQAVLSAIESATGSLPPSVAATIKASILTAMDSVIASITSSIESAISSGAMDPPTVAESATIAGNLSTVTTSTAANTASATYEAAKPPPASVDQAVAGAKSQVGAFADCDPSITGKTASTCARSVAKIMYSGLNFGVALKITGGAFATELAGGCTSGNAALVAEFPNGNFDASNAGFCVVQSLFGKVDRNRGDDRGGDNGGMIFAESGFMSGSNVGLITALGTSLFGQYKYTLANMDAIIFSYNSASQAGMNARLFNVSEGGGTAGNLSTGTYKYKNAAGTWVTLPSTPFQETSTSCASGSNYCDILPNGNGGDHVNFPFINGATGWSTADLRTTVTTGLTALQTLVPLIGGGDFTGSFAAMYGGPVPALAKLDDSFSDTTHLTNNPTGHKKIYTIYSEEIQQTPGSTSNPCFDLGATTPCLGVSGAQYPALRVDMTMASAPLSVANPVRPVTALTVGASGAFVMRPYFSSVGFTGVIGFTKVATGGTALNEINQERGIKVIVNAATECTGHHLASSCANGSVFNVTIDWSNCNGGTSCPAWDGFGTTVPEVTGLTLAVQSNIRTMPMYFGSAQMWVVGQGDFGSMTPVRVNVTVGSGRDVLVPNATGTYFLMPRFTGCPSACTIADFYLANASTGAVRGISADLDAGGSNHTTTGVCGIVSAAMSCTGVDAVTYNLAYMDTLNWGSSATLSDIAGNRFISNGPFLNPNFKCSEEPYFIDGNGNGTLDCDPANPTQVLASTGDISFADQFEYSRWYNDPANSAAPHHSDPLISRQNGFSYSDPVGAKKLLTTAFNGWFDGAHVITSTTKLDALQAFGLIYLMFSQEGGTHMSTNGVLATDKFLVSAPSDSGTGGPAGVNHLMGNGFLTFKQP